MEQRLSIYLQSTNKCLRFLSFHTNWCNHPFTSSLIFSLPELRTKQNLRPLNTNEANNAAPPFAVTSTCQIYTNSWKQRQQHPNSKHSSSTQVLAQFPKEKVLSRLQFFFKCVSLIFSRMELYLNVDAKIICKSHIIIVQVFINAV